MKRKNFRLTSVLRCVMLFGTLSAGGPMAFAVDLNNVGTQHENSVTQSKIISGIVKDDTGEALIGVNVIIAGTSKGVTTNLDGAFTLKDVPENAILTISYVGCKTQKIAIAGKTRLVVVLQRNDQSIDEVLVIGYGVQKKSNVTGSISSLKSDDLLNRPVSNAASALQGKVSGVQVINNSGAPGAAPSIRIRGYSSNGSSDPLFIVDGLKVASLEYLDPNSIERMEVLKDAASAAIYGAEAGNGVVLVTTKTGSKGNTKITFDTQFSYSSLAKKIGLLDAKEYINYYTEAVGDAFTSKLNTYYKNSPSSMIGGKLADTDWQDEMYTTGKSHKYNFGVQGGSDKGNFFLSLGYLNNDGMVVGKSDLYKRLTSQINASYKIRNWLEVGTSNSLQYSSSNQIAEGSVMYGSMHLMNQMDPLTPVEYENGLQGASNDVQRAFNAGLHPIQNPGTNNYYGVSWVNGQPQNPLASLEKSKNGNKSFSINGMTYLNITPIKGLVFTSRLGYRLGNTTVDRYDMPSIFQFGATADSELLLQMAQTSTRYYQWENFANYSFKLGEHDFSLLAGTSYTDNETDYTWGRTNELSNTAANFRYLNYSTNTANDLIGGNRTMHRQFANYGRLSWDFKKKYNLQMNFRADSYDAAYLDLDHNWGYFPSVSAGWTITNEEFMKNIDRKLLSSAKIRASYGKNGSISNLGGYMYASTLNSGYDSNKYINNSYWMNGKLYNGTYPSEYLANPKLRWEESKQFDLGLDLRLLNDRMVITADYYHKITNGLLVQSTAPLTTGTSYVYQNLGIVKNQGLELEVEWRDKIGKDFSYNIKGNIATVSNKVTKYRGEGVRINGSALVSSPTSISYFEEGYPLWYLRGYKLEGVNPTTGAAIYKDIDGNGEITDADRTSLGNGIPDFTYGMTIALSYKNFDCSIYGSGSHGAELMYGVSNIGSNWYNKPKFLYDNRWTPTNTAGSLPSPLYQTDQRFYNSDAYVFDASFFKIKQIQFGYNLPKSLINKIGFVSMRTFISLDNFFTFTSYPGNDPEVRPTDSSSMAIDLGGYPIAKSVSFGFNVSL